MTNWEDGTRHYSIAVLWDTPQAGKVAGNQYKDTCDGDPYPVISMYIAKASLSGPTSINSSTSASYTVQVSHPDGGPTPTGTVALFQQLGDKQSPKGKYCDGSPNAGVDPAVGSATLSNSAATVKTPTLADGTYKFYASYTGMPVTSSGLASYCLTPPQSGLTGALSNTMPLTVGTATQASSAQGHVAGLPAPTRARRPIAVVDLTRRAPGTVKARCRTRQAPVQTTVGSRKGVIEPSMTSTIRRGIKVETSSLPDGAKVHVQLVCRPLNAKPLQLGRAGLGTAKPDRMTTPVAKAILLGGLADDHLTVTRKRGTAFGGPGADRLTLRRAGSGSGGFGRDIIRSTATERVLLVGDAGRDTLVGGPGRTYINAQDQAGGDTVRCNSNRTFVLADPGDALVGTCRAVAPHRRGNG